MEAKERLYSTTDGHIVREGDPRGAFLAYAVGDNVADEHTGDVDKLTSKVGSTSQVFHDDDARDAARAAIANPTAATRAVLAEKLEDDPTAPVFMHDRLATELADEARERANRDEALELSATSSKKRIYRTEDGELVREGDERAAFLAYAPGDKIRRSDLDGFEALDDDDDDPAPAKTAAPVKATPAKVAQPAK